MSAREAVAENLRIVERVLEIAREAEARSRQGGNDVALTEGTESTEKS